MRKINRVLWVIFIFFCLVACGPSVKDREKEALSATGGNKVIFSKRITSDLYIHVVCRGNVSALVLTREGFLGGVSDIGTMILDPNEISCSDSKKN